MYYWTKRLTNFSSSLGYDRTDVIEAVGPEDIQEHRASARTSNNDSEEVVTYWSPAPFVVVLEHRRHDEAVPAVWAEQARPLPEGGEKVEVPAQYATA